MLFNSLQYGCFLAAVVPAYYLTPTRWRNWLLLGASYLFYASWDPRYLPLIVALTLFNFGLGYWLGRLRGYPRAAVGVLAMGIGANLLVLGFFKYTLFFLDTLTRALVVAGVPVQLPRPTIVLPLGISFFIFEFIHYLMDVHRGGPVVTSLGKFALFAAFFPTQVAGPIKRYEDFIPQIEQRASVDWERIGAGARLLIVGLFKKAALADNLAPMVIYGFSLLAPGGRQLPPSDAWLVVVAFAFQIYFDFSGYTDMGRGAALLLGFSVPENFRRPYLAVNVSDFWRRWHISLSSWLRDYLYIPLGGNRRRQARNLLVTMTLGGLWHGPSTVYIVWGFFHGLLLTAFWWTHPRRPTGPAAPPVSRTSPSFPRAPRAVLGWALTFALVCIGWVFFRAANTSQALRMIGYLLGRGAADPGVLLGTQRLTILAIAIGCLAIEGWQEWQARMRLRPDWRPSPDLGWIGSVMALPRQVAWGAQALATWRTDARLAGYVALFALTLVVQPNDSPRFIYFQF